MPRFGPMRCSICNRAYKPSEGTEGRTAAGVKVWVCKKCEAKGEPIPPRKV